MSGKPDRGFKSHPLRPYIKKLPCGEFFDILMCELGDLKGIQKRQTALRFLKPGLWGRKFFYVLCASKIFRGREIPPSPPSDRISPPPLCTGSHDILYKGGIGKIGCPGNRTVRTLRDERKKFCWRKKSWKLINTISLTTKKFLVLKISDTTTNSTTTRWRQLIRE